MPLNSFSTWRSHALKLTLGLFVSCSAAMVNVATAEEEKAADGKVASIANLIDGLEARLQSDPNDMKGWVLLAKSYQYMQRTADAKAAFDRAVKLGYEGPLPGMGKPAKPGVNNHHKNGYMHSPLANAITDVTEKGASEAESAPGIKIKVTLAPEVAKKLKGSEPVFVFAKLPKGKGMPAPLAVAKKTVSDLPFEITLNDNMAMMPGHTISSASEVIVGARISMSGGVKKQGGDLEALSQAIPSSSKEQVVLAISE